MSNNTEVRILESLNDVTADQWDTLVGSHPALCHAFLQAMHKSGAASPDTGWHPVYPSLWRSGILVGAMPLYIKTHSYGEYVFDWAWADAYERHGLHYYPKLLSAIPFTPIAGPRLLATTQVDRQHLLETALKLLEEDEQLSSLHVLFPDDYASPICQHYQGLQRDGIQFHWHNRAYADFDDFLACMSHDKRKKIHQDRKRALADIDYIECLQGEDISTADWAFFHRCYTHTYHMHRSAPYLGHKFFESIHDSMPSQSVMFVAYRHQQRIASSWCLRGQDVLFGRYWGAMEYVPCLHFELCYYQPIAFCIRQQLARFEGGTQGEHKLARGLLPVTTRSFHWLKRPQFNHAVADFLQQERDGIAIYLDDLNDRQPFRSDAVK
ncbi:GNAT family N-acetyltransferase [Chitinivorax sp. B]|uniref:GNAT family N-acetyltransferase n=1 Tax=Chitinivorax sp. B TaxID=2502235 RepID=UPI0010F4EC58|nr:GNAT family N-acetyltransferase [Chitinivorax sp. B]